MKITTGGLELFKTTTFLASGLGETVVVVDDDPEPVRFVLDFVEDADGSIGIETKKEGAKTLRITLNNWSNPVGTTFLEPVDVGVYNKRLLFLLFSVHKVGNTGQVRAVTFSLYLGEKV